MPIICPSCQKDDRIYKVSVVYSGGLSHGSFSGSEGPVSGTSQTVLSGKLAPLPKPSISCFVTGCSGIFIAMSALGFLAVALWSDAFRGSGAIVSYLVYLVLGLLGLGIYLLGSLSVRKKMPQWEAAMKVWDRCYYCDRDGIVFDPISGTTIPTDGFNDYLKKTAA